MASGQGHVAFLGIGEEDTWGTAVSMTDFVRLMSETLRENRTFGYPHGTGGASRRVAIPQTVFVEGDATVMMNYDGFGLLLKHLLGSVESSQQGATDAYLHTFSLADTLPTGLSLEVDRDKTSYTYEGCKISQAVFNAAVGSPLEATFSVIGEDVNTDTASSETFPTTRVIYDSHFSLELDDGVLDVTDVSITVNNNLTGGERANLGSTTIKEPIRNGAREVSGTITAEFDTITLWDQFTAGASGKLELIWTGANIEDSYDHELKMQLAVAYLEGGAGPQVGGPGPITQTFEFTGIYDETNTADEIVVTLQNTETSI